MGITKRVEEAVKETEQRFNESQGFRELRDFYADMQRRGLAIKKEYDIPPLDTAGRLIYRMVSRE
ncbi:MAG: hypothetical protein ACREBC_27400 [Pyrinomonadaceae bacterium]